MALALDDALAGWIVSSAGSRLIGLVRQNPAALALRAVVSDAVDAAIADVADHLEDQQVSHLRDSVLVGDRDLNEASVSDLNQLRTALQTWTEALDYPEFGAHGYLAQLGVDVNRFGDSLTSHIAAGIQRNGRLGGPLQPVAEWFWRDEVKAGIDNLQQDLASFRAVIESAEPAAGGLPGDTSNFTGRIDVVAELSQRIGVHTSSGAGTPVHVIGGMAGVGKTALAIHIAQRIENRYPDGALFLDLHGYTPGIDPATPELALEELLVQAGVHRSAIPAGLWARQARWRSVMAKRRALVVLDNVLDTAQVDPLLPRSAGSLVLITSRSRMTGMRGVNRVSLDVLSAEDAVALFVRLVGEQRCPDEDEVAVLVQAVGRLPLAIEMLAGQLNSDAMLTTADLAADLAHASGRLDATSPEESGIRAAFEVSLARLSEANRSLFKAFGLHDGPLIGVPQFAALADVGCSAAARVLHALAERHLIKTTSQSCGHRRYGLHDLVRDFVREKADAEFSEQSRARALHRLVGWYAGALYSVEQLWDSTTIGHSDVRLPEGLRLGNDTDAREWIRAEEPNLLALTRIDGYPALGQLFRVSARRLQLISRYSSAQQLYQAALEQFCHAGNADGKARTLVGLGDITRLAGTLQKAGALYREAYLTFSERANHQGQADALRGLGQVEVSMSNYLVAAACYEKALLFCRQVRDRRGEAHTLASLGHVYRMTGDFELSADHYSQAHALCAVIMDPLITAHTSVGLGRLAVATGDYLNASSYCRRAYDTYRQIGSQRGLATALVGLGDLARAKGNPIVSRAHYHDALQVSKQIGHKRLEANVLWGLGQLEQTEGRQAGAKRYFQAALKIHREVGDRRGELMREAGLREYSSSTPNWDAPEIWQYASIVAIEASQELDISDVV